jgi:hypothetical protein
MRNWITRLESAEFVTATPATKAAMASAFVGHPGCPADRAAEASDASDWAFLWSRVLFTEPTMLATFGMAMLAIMAITAITTNNSTIEKAAELVFILLFDGPEGRQKPLATLIFLDGQSHPKEEGHGLDRCPSTFSKRFSWLTERNG